MRGCCRFENGAPELRMLVRRKSEKTWQQASIWHCRWDRQGQLRLRRGRSVSDGLSNKQDNVRLIGGRCWHGWNHHYLRPRAKDHGAILVKENEGLDESDERQDGRQPHHPVGLLLLSYAGTIFFAIVLGLYAADWSNSFVGDLLSCIACGLILDALFSLIWGLFPWEWLCALAFVCGA